MKNVIGLFEKPRVASEAIARLADMGLSEQHISLVTNEDTDKDSFAITENTKFPEGVATGALTGGVLGALVGGLAAAGAVASGGFGVLASGPIAAAFAAGGFGAAGGGILGGVYGTVIPDDEHQVYDDAIKKGGAVVAVECDDDKVSDVKDTFNELQAKRINVG